MVKLGIIGLGHMGGYHASICSSLHPAKLVAVADLDQKNLEKITRTDVIKSTNYEDWLNLVDAVIIAVPTQFHYIVAKRCLLLGKHVLIEKPLTKTIKEAQELFEIAQANNLALHVGHVERFNSAVQELKKIVHEPYLIESQRVGPFSPRPQNDSVVLDLMIHDLDIILSIVNSPIKSLNVIGNCIKTNLDDIAVVQIKFENGVLANMISSRMSQIKKRTMSIHQKNCFIQLDFSTQDISIHSRMADSFKINSDQLHYKKQETVEHLLVYKDNPLKIEIENFINSIRTKSNLIDAQQDIQALKLALELDRLLGIKYIQ
jgi:predicted dehydrogenase